MKSNFKYFAWALAASAVLWLGCQEKTPPFSAAAATVDSYDVLVFEPNGAAETVVINPNLPVVDPGEPLGYLTVGPWGINMNVIPEAFVSFPTNIVDPNGQLVINGVPCGSTNTCSAQPGCCPTGGSVTVDPSGLSTDPYEIHMTGWIDDPESYLYSPGPGNYDSLYFRLWPGYNHSNITFTPNYTLTASCYDLSPFSGLEFYIKVAGYDNALTKQCDINTLQSEKGSPAGTCQTVSDPNDQHCYDPFYYDYSAIPRDQWVFVQQPWTAFKPYGNGSIPNPPTLSGQALQQFMFITFLEGNAAIAGPVTCDYAVTGVKFY